MIHAGTGKRKGAHRVLMRKPEEKGPFGKPRHRWEDNIESESSGSGMGSWTGLISLRIGISGELL